MIRKPLHKTPNPPKKYFSYAAILLLCALACVSLTWALTQHIVAQQAQTLLTDLAHTGCTIDHAPIQKSGWPFGASLTIPSLQATCPLPAQDATSHDAVLILQGRDLHLGHNWLSTIIHPRTLHLNGTYVARAQWGDTTLTLISHGTTITAAHQQHITLSATLLTLSVITPENTHNITLTTPAFDLLTPQSLAHTTTLGLHLTSPQIMSDIPFLEHITDFSGAIALTTPTPASWHTLPPTMMLHVPIASMTLHTPQVSAPVTASGNFSLPQHNGHLTITLPQWLKTAHAFMQTMQSRTPLPLTLQKAVNDLFSSSKLNFIPHEAPISFEIQILNGNVQPNFIQMLQQFHTQKIDAKTAGE